MSGKDFGAMAEPPAEPALVVEEAPAPAAEKKTPKPVVEEKPAPIAEPTPEPAAEEKAPKPAPTPAEQAKDEPETPADRKTVASGKRVTVGVELGRRSKIKKTEQNKKDNK